MLSAPPKYFKASVHAGRVKERGEKGEKISLRIASVTKIFFFFIIKQKYILLQDIYNKKFWKACK